ncbi:MAG: thioredoxin domain-containing protein, partial [Vicinamibacteria bacterium]
MSDREPNRLIDETSPYLLQHARNPVAWYPWGEEALLKARAEDKPILLSIGYSACHWCHVMERESFENEDIAALMNESFLSIKVDREERPDLDEIYMSAVQMLTGSGGWPLTVFLTPELEPFYGGTYFPPEDRWGRPGFPTVLREIARVFREDRSRVRETSKALTDRIQSLAFTPATRELLSRSLIAQAARKLAMRFDPREGGFSAAPKFPPSGAISLLLRYHRASRDPDAREMVELTLDKMAAGGMYDHLGGGFHRYSTDAVWLVPHFEKMLYDNALLARAYLEAYQVTGKEDYARVAGETLEWVMREMQGEECGYFSTQDADSEGVEGKFYVWSEEELRRLLGDRAEEFSRVYDVTPGGNWDGENILHRPAGFSSSDPALESSLRESRAILFRAREKRVRPGLDDKVLASWNGLAIIAMARGYQVLGEERFLSSARRAARFLEGRMFRDGRLLATYRAGRAKLKGYLDDYAFVLGGFVELFESDFDVHWLERATELASGLESLFLDRDAGGFFFTGSDHEPLIARTKSGYDGALPSGNGMAATYLLKLSEYTG